LQKKEKKSNDIGKKGSEHTNENKKDTEERSFCFHPGSNWGSPACQADGLTNFPMKARLFQIADALGTPSRIYRGVKGKKRKAPLREKDKTK
jgi:hypothetical protein